MGNLPVLHRIEEQLTRIADALEKKNAAIDMGDVHEQLLQFIPEDSNGIKPERKAAETD